jgi:heme/copper-type cytochrome/quinol oxidase subunit 2
MRDKVLVALVMVFALASLGVGYAGAAVLGVGTMTTTTTQTTTFTQTTATQNASEPYTLTLVISTGNTFNSTVGEQPAFYVVGQNGLQPATSIFLPAHRLIKLVIFNYDDGNASLVDPAYANVNGTTGGTITFANNGILNSTQTPSGISIGGPQTVSSVPADLIAHTFTIPSLGINVPVPVSSTVVATFTLDKAGTFSWFCMTACGTGADGLGGAMITPGWMTGSVTVG